MSLAWYKWFKQVVHNNPILFSSVAVECTLKPMFTLDKQNEFVCVFLHLCACASLCLFQNVFDKHKILPADFSSEDWVRIG